MLDRIGRRGDTEEGAIFLEHLLRDVLHGILDQLADRELVPVRRDVWVDDWERLAVESRAEGRSHRSREVVDVAEAEEDELCVQVEGL